MRNLRSQVRDLRSFSRPGILPQDITPLVHAPRASRQEIVLHIFNQERVTIAHSKTHRVTSACTVLGRTQGWHLDWASSAVSCRPRSPV